MSIQVSQHSESALEHETYYSNILVDVNLIPLLDPSNSNEPDVEYSLQITCNSKFEVVITCNYTVITLHL